MIRVTVKDDDHQMRLDRFLRRNLSLQSLPAIYKMIRKGAVKVEGKKRKENYRLSAGETVEIGVDPAEFRSQRDTESRGIQGLTETEFFRRNFVVLHEDSALIVCNKPVHVVVHPGTGHQGPESVIEMAQSYLAKKGEKKEPVLVHRLDRDTSGVILIAKGKRNLRLLHDSFRGDLVKKTYTAMVHGRPDKYKGTISAALDQTSSRNEGMKVHVSDRGKSAETSYTVEASAGGISRLSVDLHTGRTHQIRVHLTHIGCPIIGDPRYGDPQRDKDVFSRGILRRLYLHATVIEFPHPRDGRPMRVTAPVPSEFRDSRLLL